MKGLEFFGVCFVGTIALILIFAVITNIIYRLTSGRKHQTKDDKNQQ